MLGRNEIFPFFDWRKIVRWYYTWRYARTLGVAPAQVDISGHCVIHGGGLFVVGKNVTIRATSRLPVELYSASGATLTLADGCFLNQGVHVACCQSVRIGEQCLLGDQVLIMDSDFHGIGEAPAKSAPVILESKVWIGARAIILKGVTIGERSVVGSGAVVTRSVPPRSIAAGNPAKVVRRW